MGWVSWKPPAQAAFCPPTLLPAPLSGPGASFWDCLCHVDSLFTCHLPKCLIRSGPPCSAWGCLRAVSRGRCGSSSLGPCVIRFARVGSRQGWPLVDRKGFCPGRDLQQVSALPSCSGARPFPGLTSWATRSPAPSGPVPATSCLAGAGGSACFGPCVMGRVWAPGPGSSTFSQLGITRVSLWMSAHRFRFRCPLSQPSFVQTREEEGVVHGGVRGPRGSERQRQRQRLSFPFGGDASPRGFLSDALSRALPQLWTHQGAKIWVTAPKLSPSCFPHPQTSSESLFGGHRCPVCCQLFSY